MIGLVNPIFIWAFAAILVPVAIHFLSQKEPRVIYLGSTKLIENSVTKKFRSIKLNQILLLILRGLLLLLLVLILTGVYFISPSGLPKWALFENGTLNTPEGKALRDSLERSGYEVRSFSKNFPPLDNATNPQPDINNYWTLSQDLDNIALSDAVIVSWMKASRFSGKRISLPANQHWIPIDHASAKFIVGSEVFKKDSLALTTGLSTSTETSFETTIVERGSNTTRYEGENLSDSVKIDKPQNVQVQIISDDSTSKDCKVIKASLLAISQTFHNKVNILKPTPNKPAKTADYTIWLSSQKPEIKLKRSITYQLDSTASQLLRKTEDGWVLTKHLTQSLAISENLTLTLADILLNNQKRDSLIANHDWRAMASTMAWSNVIVTKADIPKQKTYFQKTESWLLILFFITLIIERIVSWIKNQ